jgi:hypothetical protein
LLVVGPQDKALPAGHPHQQGKPADNQQVAEKPNRRESFSSAGLMIRLRIVRVQFVYTVIPLVARGAQRLGCSRLAVVTSSIPYEYFTQTDVKSVRNAE